MIHLENILGRGSFKLLLVIVLFCVSCKTDSNENISPTSIQYIQIKTEAYDINNDKLGEFFLPIDSNGTYYYFNSLVLRCVVACEANSASLPHNYCILPKDMDSTYFPFTKSTPIWSFKTTSDTILGIIYNPGDTIYYPTVDRFEYYLVKSNYLPVDSAKCN